MASKGEMTMFGKYLLLRKIDTGGMGEIFLAKQGGAAGFEKYVVVKRVLSQHLDNDDFIQMFLQEAKTTSKFNHANIVQVYDFGEMEGSYFTAMEYIHGKGLDAIIERCKKQKRHIHPAHIIEIISGVCAGLSYAHNMCDPSTMEPMHIIHRDVNPQNIMINYNGGVKVIDFGIAKSEMNENKTETGTLKGKFVYMSPEQSRAQQLDKRSDIFPIGICLYQLCGYDNPFAKPNIVLSLEAIQKEDPPPLSTISEEYACFDPILNKALAKDPNERYADCRDMQNDLQRLLISGAVQPAEQSLADFMADLYAEALAKDRERMKQYASIHVPEKGEQSSGNIPTQNNQNDYQQNGYNQGTSSGNIPLQNNNMMNSGNIPLAQPWMNNGYNPMMPRQTMTGITYPPMGPDPTSQMMYNQMSMGFQAPPVQKSNRLGVILAVLVILLAGGGVSAFIIMQARNKALGPNKSAVSAISAVKPIETAPAVVSTAASTPEVANNEQPNFAKPAVAAKEEAKAPESKPVEKPAESVKPVAKEESKPIERKAAPEPKKEEPKEQKVVIVKRSEPAPEPAKPAPEPKKEEPKPAPSPAKPAPKPAPEPVSAPAPVNQGPVGDILVSSSPSGTRVKINGVKAGMTPGVKAELNSNRGTIVVGDTNSAFDVKINYTVSDGNITYSVTTDPVALMSFGGVAMGNTPQKAKSKGGIDKFEFVNTATNERMNVILKFTKK